MTYLKYPLLISLFLFAGLGCGEDEPTPVNPIGEVTILVSKEEYSKQTGTPITAVLVNLSLNPVYLHSCHPNWTIERQENAGGWTDLGSWYGICDGPSMPIPIESGSYTEAPPISQSIYGTWESGSYRLRAEVYGNGEAKQLLPDDQRVSDPFQIVE